MMRQVLKFLPIFLLVAALTGCLARGIKTEFPGQKKTTPGPSIQEVSQVTLVLDFGEPPISTFSGLEAQTAFEALTKLAQEENLEIQTKEYDIGILVEKIGERENTEEKAWLYYVNGKMADKAADKYEVQDGDVVEWKYEKLKF